MSFSHAELGALRAVRRALGDVDVVIIGAAALRQLANFHWRTTYDLDLTVALDEDAYPSALVGSQELKQDIRLQHRWYAAGVSLDILPAGPSLREQGWIRWGEHRMSLAGLGLAFEHAITVALAPDLVVRVAPPAVIAVLKMIAYCERPAERERDLHDLSHLLDEYLGSDDDRRFDDRVLAAQLPWDHVSAHELGHDIGRIISASDKQAIDTFLDRAPTGDVVGTLPRMLRGPTVELRRARRAAARAIGRVRGRLAGCLATVEWPAYKLHASREVLDGPAIAMVRSEHKNVGATAHRFPRSVTFVCSAVRQEACDRLEARTLHEPASARHPTFYALLTGPLLEELSVRFFPNSAVPPDRRTGRVR